MSHQGDVHRAFADMWNKLYTNQGTILEPLLKRADGTCGSKGRTVKSDNWIRGNQKYKRAE